MHSMSLWGVANHHEGSGPEATVALRIAASEGLAVEGEAEVRLPIAEGGEGRVTFRIRAGRVPGAERLTLSASVGEETVERGGACRCVRQRLSRPA